MPLGPCGLRGDPNQARALEAQIYLMERYSCGPLTSANLSQAVQGGDASQVSTYLSGTAYACGNALCQRDMSALPPLNAGTVKQFVATFDVAIRNGIESPSYALDELIANHPAIQQLFFFRPWVCGPYNSEILGRRDFKGYGTIELIPTKAPTRQELQKIKDTVVSIWSKAAQKPMDDKRVQVVRGPDRVRTIFDLSKRDASGRYVTTQKTLPTIHITITPACSGSSRPCC